jgi:hypothetical protein
MRATTTATNVQTGVRKGGNNHRKNTRSNDGGATVPSYEDIRVTFNGFRLSDVHGWFKDYLSPVAIRDRGDPNFASARSCWNCLVADYQPAAQVQRNLLGYAFRRTAAAIYQTVLNDSGQGANVDEIWDGTQAKIYNDDQIEAQILSSTMRC